MRPSLAALIGLSSLVGCSTPAVELASAAPVLLCDEGGETTLTLTGAGLGPTVTGALNDEPVLVMPTVWLSPVGGVAEGEAATATADILVPADRVESADPSTLTIRVDGALGLTPGAWAVRVAPVTGPVATLDPALVVMGPPVVSALDPDSVCQESASNTLELSGSGLLVIDGVGPALTVDGVALAATATDCLPLAAPATGEVCSGLLVTLDATTMAFGTAELELRNPAPADCAADAPVRVEVLPPPELLSVAPAELCRLGGSITLSGSNFEPTTQVTVGGLPSPAVRYVDAETLEADLPELPEAGSYDVSVTNTGDCTAELPAALTVADPPLVYLVEPPTLPADRPTTLTLWASDIVGTLTAVTLARDDGSATVDLEFSWDSSRPGTLTAAVPAGLAPGAWTVSLTQDEACAADEGGAVEIVDAWAVALAGVEPAHAWTWSYTPIEVTADDPPAHGMQGLQDGSRAWLIGADGATVRLLGSTWRDAASLVTVVPPLTDPGVWDLLVVGPDGSAGLLDEAIEVVEESPPTIDSASPASLSRGTAESLTVRGSDFRDPTVSLDCRENGSVTTLWPAVDAWTATAITLTVDTGSVGQAVCVVGVENGDGTSARWSAISITNPAQNLFPWTTGPDLVEARRAPSAVAARTSSVSRHAYVIGGDAGDPATASDSLERASVGVYGDLDPWSLMPDPLPAPRTLAQAVEVEGFVYLMGGHDGTDALATVLRAQVLDPLQVPWLDELDVERAADMGLGAGTWIWRVSALLDPADASNPGGESLAGDALVLTLPAVDGLLVPTLTWSAVTGAVGYRVYRSPVADAASSDLEWLADVGEGVTSYTDTGDATTAGLVPLAEGALGQWASQPGLTTAREAPCLAVGWDPRPDPPTAYIYLAGGRDSAGDLLDTVEVLDITIDGADAQTAGAWTLLDVHLVDGRTRCGGWTVTSDLNDAIADDESWVYFGGGDSDRKAEGDVVAGRVDEGGLLADWQEVDGLNPARSGFASFAASNFLYAIAGGNGAPSASGASCSLDPDDVPVLENWNSLGTSLSAARSLVATAQESSVVFVVGGESETDAATRATDWTNF